MTTPTLGAQRVRLDFNPNSNTAVDRIKHAGAALIDAINDETGDPRLKALAMTATEEAAMWGLKAVIAPKMSPRCSPSSSAASRSLRRLRTGAGRAPVRPVREDAGALAGGNSTKTEAGTTKTCPEETPAVRAEHSPQTA